MSATLSTPAQVTTALGGGTWVAWGAGRVAVGVNANDTDFDTVEKTGGSKELQKHTHTMQVNNIAYYKAGGGQIDFSSGAGGDFWSGTNNPETNPAGTGQSGNLQPYITCYMYKRTA